MQLKTERAGHLQRRLDMIMCIKKSGDVAPMQNLSHDLKPWRQF